MPPAGAPGQYPAPAPPYPGSAGYPGAPATPYPGNPGIPTQRTPQWPDFAPPTYQYPYNPAIAAERTSSKRVLLVAAAVFFVLALLGTVGVVVVAAHRAGVETAADAAAPTAPKTPATPFDTASAALEAQAAALIKGDEAGWLAVVDPGQSLLRTRYRTMYASLRALGVTQFEYHPFVQESKEKSATTVAMGVDITYCFSLDTCPSYADSEWQGAPRISQSLVLKPIGGRYLITSAAKAKEPNHLQPTPWESGDLVFAQGKRVTVGAPKSEASHLNQVLAIADRAAAVNDRFAVYVNNPQKRYRIYLADNKAWRSWYGGETDKWIVAYTIPLNEAESDVVLQTSQLLGDSKLMATTIQHELGHVVTLGAVHGGSSDDKNLWLIEGVAEYIGWSPSPATASWRRQSVREAVHGAHPPKSIATKPLADNAGARAGDTFYGLGHFAVDCMATKFGQRKMFEFVKLTLREGYGYEQASQEAYGKPFSSVDKACVSWIKAEA